MTRSAHLPGLVATISFEPLAELLPRFLAAISFEPLAELASTNRQLAGARSALRVRVLIADASHAFCAFHFRTPDR